MCLLNYCPMFLFNVAWGREDFLLAHADSQVDVLLIERSWCRENDVSEEQILSNHKCKIIFMDELDLDQVAADYEREAHPVFTPEQVSEDHTWCVF